MYQELALAIAYTVRRSAHRASAYATFRYASDVWRDDLYDAMRAADRLADQADEAVCDCEEAT